MIFFKSVIWAILWFYFGVIKEFFTFWPKSEDSSFYSSLLGPKVKFFTFWVFLHFFEKWRIFTFILHFSKKWRKTQKAKNLNFWAQKWRIKWRIFTFRTKSEELFNNSQIGKLLRRVNNGPAGGCGCPWTFRTVPQNCTSYSIA